MNKNGLFLLLCCISLLVDRACWILYHGLVFVAIACDSAHKNLIKFVSLGLELLHEPSNVSLTLIKQILLEVSRCELPGKVIFLLFVDSSQELLTFEHILSLSQSLDLKLLLLV